MDVQWMVCPSCQLKHRHRAEATCPRCASPLEAAPAPASVAPPVEPAAKDSDDYETHASLQARQAAHPGGALRLAGGVMLCNVLLLLASLGVQPQPGEPLPHFTFLVPAVIDLCLGISLLRGNDRYRPLVLARVILGLLLLGGMQLAQGSWVLVVAQALLSAALLLLLVGEPGWVRRTMAVVLAACYLLPSGAMLVYARTGEFALPAPLRRLVAGPALDAHPMDSDMVRGRKFAYHLRVPGEGWLLRGPEATLRDNPQLDLWLYEPDSSTHLLVLNRSELHRGVSVQDAVSTLVENVRATHKDFSPFEFGTYDSPSITLKYARGRGSEGPLLMDMVLFALTAPDGGLYRFISYGPADRFDAVRADVVEAVKSFQLE